MSTTITTFCLTERQQSFSREGLTMGDQEICYAAMTIFTSVCLSIQDGSVTAEVLKKLSSKQEEVQKLCEAITSQEKQPGDNLETSIPIPSFSFENISESLNTRLREYKAFIEHQKELSTLVQHLSDLNIPGESNCYSNDVEFTFIYIELNNIRADLEKNFEVEPISSLCQQVDRTMIFYSFQSALPLFPIISDFTALVTKYPNNTFNDHWNAEKKGVQNMPLQLVDVVKHVWEPVFMKCCVFLKSLQDKSIRLAEVDKLLDHYTEKKLIFEIKQLEKGICNSNGLRVVFRECGNIALFDNMQVLLKLFLDLKVTLDLNGDFDIVERLATKVSSY